ncbi:hypothetical protein B0H13DRAFT_1994452, partial [Mycena leptocephala]
MPGRCGARLWVEREDGLVLVLVRPREDDAAWAAADAPDVCASTTCGGRGCGPGHSSIISRRRPECRVESVSRSQYAGERDVAQLSMTRVWRRRSRRSCMLRYRMFSFAGATSATASSCRSPLPFSPPSALPSPSQPFPHLWIFIFESVLTPPRTACANGSTSSSPSSTAGGSSARCQRSPSAATSPSTRAGTTSRRRRS